MSEEITQAELKSLVNLLDDPDNTVFRQVTARLRMVSNTIVPDLEKYIIIEKNSLRKERLKRLIEEIHFNILVDDFTEWCRKDYFNMLELLVIVAHYKFPNLNFIEVKQTVHDIISQVKQETNTYSTPLQRIRTLNHVLFQIHKFSANFSDPMHPNNTFINIVLKEKKGSDIILGILYMYIADQLGMPVYGVNFPKNFLLAYIDIDIQDKTLGADVSFYINPFNHGIILTKADIDVFLKQNKISAKTEYYIPANQLTIAERLLKYLSISYKRKKQQVEVEDIKNIIQILKYYKDKVK